MKKGNSAPLLKSYRVFPCLRPPCAFSAVLALRSELRVFNEILIVVALCAFVGVELRFGTKGPTSFIQRLMH